MNFFQVDINTDKDIVIIDEGHNIEDICREAGSLLLKQIELEDAIKNCKENISRFIKPGNYKVIVSTYFIKVIWILFGYKKKTRYV